MDLFNILLGFDAGLVLLGGIFHTDIVTRLFQISSFAKAQYSIHPIIFKSWQTLADLYIAGAFGYSFYASFRRYSRAKKTVGILVAVGVVATILLVNLDLTIPFTLITIVGVISIALVIEFNRAQLEMLVNQRTAELDQTNTRLKKRIKYLEKEIALFRQRESSAQALIESDLHQHIADLDLLNQVMDLNSDIEDISTVFLSVSAMITERLNASSTLVLIASDEVEDATVLQGFDREKGPIGPILMNDLNSRNTALVQKIFLNRKSIVITDITSPVIPPYLQQLMALAEIQNTLLLPLCIRGEIKGFVSVSRGPPFDPFGAEDTKFAEAVGNHIARAIENAGIVKTAKETAVREERDRLARDMHDSVTQTIYSASLITAVLPNIWDRNPEEGKRDLVKVRQLVHGALAEMRTILFELRPSALEMVSLETLLRQLVVAISGRERIHVQMWTEGDYPLPLNVKTAVYRIAQEVFNNIAKHSEATEVLTILKLRSDGLTLDIADNGKGFLTSQESSKGMGLRIMQERAALIGARIDIASEPAQGTVVNVTWGGNQKEIINGVSCSNPTDDCG
jgi:signal transduction histidine kinase